MNRDQMLLDALPDVVFEGWPSAELAEHFSDWADRQMAAEMAKLDIPSMRVRDRVAAGVRLRLEALTPHREAVRRLLTFLSLPHNAPLGVRLTWATAGEIWYAAGDESADFNYYTKRGLLVPVLASTTLAWLADDSDDFAETWAFLDRRIAEVLKLPPLMAKLPTPANIFKRFAAAVEARR